MKQMLPRLAHGALVAGGLGLLALFCLGLVVLGRGYLLYRQALEEASVAQKLEEVRSIPGYTTLDRMPPFYIQAVLAAEDHRFYSHPGYDIFAIGRAVWNDLLAGRFVQGGSTITQQLAKNLWFTQEKRLVRKAAELFMAIELENVCTKHEILEAYLNSIFFGSGYTGIGQAAEGYYGTAPDGLDMAQCAMLAGIPNAPTAYALDAHPELAAQRQRQVLRQMVRRHFLTEQQAEAILPGSEAVRPAAAVDSLLFSCLKQALFQRSRTVPFSSFPVFGKAAFAQKAPGGPAETSPGGSLLLRVQRGGAAVEGGVCPVPGCGCG